MSSLENLKLAVSDFPQFTNSSLREYLQYRCDTFAARCIAHSLPAWRKITSDHEILSTVVGMKIYFNATPCQKYLPTCARSATETTIIDLEVQKLLSKHVIEPTGHCHEEIISNYFVRGKKDGSHRMILNFKNLNQYANKIHFKMDTLNTINKLVEQDCFMASIDLKDAYYSILIATSARKYLKFSWKGKLYQFTCLPNGLSFGPRKFTKLLKPALSHLHLRGHISSGYIDDLYLQGKTYVDCVHNVIHTLIQIDSLGLITHPEKSVFNPSQALLHTASPTIREVACVLGKIVSSFPGVMYGPLHYRRTEQEKIRALRNNQWNFDRRMSLPPRAKSELEWWVENVMTAKNFLTRGGPTCTLTTDASNEGWGAVYGNQSTGGLWSSDEKSHHINFPELLAVFLGLKVFCRSHSDTNIRLQIDNTTAVTVINHMETSHSEQLNTLTNKIWAWCISRNLWVSAAHIAGKSNVEADHESKQHQTATEWMLNKALLSQALESLQFTPEIDLFASRLNCQFPQYVAYRPDPGAMDIDAFSLIWTGLKFYAFPPFSVIPSLLKKIQEDKAEGVCVLPNCPTQPWFPKAMQMITRSPVELKACETLMSLPNQPEQIHPLHKGLNLLVWLLSAKS